MKKVIKSIWNFFFGDIIKLQKSKRFDEAKEKQEAEAQTAWNKFTEGTFYHVSRKGEFLSYEKNLLAVSKAYPELKKSTLYNAFKDEENSSRTYERKNYKIVECQRF